MHFFGVSVIAIAYVIIVKVHSVPALYHQLMNGLNGAATEDI